MPLSGGRADRGIPLPGSATPDCLNRRRVRTSPLKIRLQMIPPCKGQCLLVAVSWHSHRGPEKRKQCMNACCEMVWAALHTISQQAWHIISASLCLLILGSPLSRSSCLATLTSSRECWWLAAQARPELLVPRLHNRPLLIAETVV